MIYEKDLHTIKMATIYKSTVDLAEILPVSISRPRKISKPKPKPVSKNYGYKLEISGQEWYHRFYSNKDTRSIGLDSVLTNDDGLIVAHNVKLFSYFPSPIDFIKYIQTVPTNKWNFFEVIQSGVKQKPYFDIDIPLDKYILFTQKYPGYPDKLREFGPYIMEMIMNQIVASFKSFNRPLDLSKDIAVYKSCSSTKESYHIVIHGYYVLSSYENMWLYNYIFSNFPPELMQFIDVLYKELQQYRIYLSQKPDSNRPKVLCKDWTFGGISGSYHTLVTDKTIDGDLKMYAEFTHTMLDSLVTYTKKAKYLYLGLSVESLDKPRRRTRGSDIDITLDTTTVTSVMTHVDTSVWKIREVSKTWIYLQRRKPAVCPVCIKFRGSEKESIHTSDNASIYVSPETGYGYFICWRKSDSWMRIEGFREESFIHIPEDPEDPEDLEDISSEYQVEKPINLGLDLLINVSKQNVTKK